MARRVIPLSASTTTVWRPARPVKVAALAPAVPPPTMARSYMVVLLLDPRVVTRRYGPLVLNGLPRAERVVGPWAQVRTRCEDFFARFGIGASV